MHHNTPLNPQINYRHGSHIRVHHYSQRVAVPHRAGGNLHKKPKVDSRSKYRLHHGRIYATRTYHAPSLSSQLPKYLTIPQTTPRGFDKSSAPTAFIGLLFAFLGLSDLTALSLSDEVAERFWGTQTPVRLTFLFGITGYAYLFKEGGMLAGKGRSYSYNAGDDLKNSIVFTWGFLEMAIWFWVFVSLRDERRQRTQKLIEKRKAEAAMM